MKYAMPITGGLSLTFAMTGVLAQVTKQEANYPARPVRFIAPFVPGGPSDILSRMLRQNWAKPLGSSSLSTTAAAPAVSSVLRSAPRPLPTAIPS